MIKSFLKCLIGSVSDEQIVIQERDTSTVIIDGDCLINDQQVYKNMFNFPNNEENTNKKLFSLPDWQKSEVK